MRNVFTLAQRVFPFEKRNIKVKNIVTFLAKLSISLLNVIYRFLESIQFEAAFLTPITYVKIILLQM